MHPYSITSTSTRRLSVRVHFGYCAQCGRAFAKRRRPQMKFCTQQCYGRYRSETFRGEAHPTYRGRVKRGQYIGLYMPGHPLAANDGYVLEHRLVLHEAGVDLPEGHHVHHKNHDKHDNRRENLEVLSATEHRRQHVDALEAVTNQYGTWPRR